LQYALLEQLDGIGVEIVTLRGMSRDLDRRGAAEPDAGRSWPRGMARTFNISLVDQNRSAESGYAGMQTALAGFCAMQGMIAMHRVPDKRPAASFADMARFLTPAEMSVGTTRWGPRARWTFAGSCRSIRARRGWRPMKPKW
jgi:hypothetical protein